MFSSDNIPAYDPTIEKRSKPKKGEITTEGIWVGVGEHKKLINPETIWLMAELGCSDKEICDWFGITESTLRFNFSGFMTKARVSLKTKLRRAQLTVALGGNPALLIWLGKNLLGQSDTQIDSDTAQVLPWTQE